MHNLAIFGGTPAFQEHLHVGRPNIGNRERLIERINNILNRRWLSNNGPYVQDFERRICDLIGVKNCIAMCNATIALEIVIRAVGLSGEVIVPSFTFIATAHALQWQEITPVFCDIDANTHNIDPNRVEGMITPRTTGIIGVHVWGRPCDIDKLAEIAQRHNLKLVFDAAHAFSCSFKSRMIGNFGNAEVFSFHATKFLNTFEGGAVVTNDDELANRIRLMKNFGFVGYDDVMYIGMNGKMSEVSAAMGLTGLECLEDFIGINRRNYIVYQEQIKGIPGIKLVEFNEKEKCNYQSIILEIDEKTAGISRDHLIMILHAENVLARRYFYPGCHQMQPYRSYLPHAKLLLPETEKLVKRVLSLPTGTAVGREEIIKICQIIRIAVSNNVKIRKRLGTKYYYEGKCCDHYIQPRELYCASNR
jgi:dTDP-4-amino-4,6-dideoxygalactose transaminase